MTVDKKSVALTVAVGATVLAVGRAVMNEQVTQMQANEVTELGGPVMTLSEIGVALSLVFLAVVVLSVHHRVRPTAGDSE